LRRAPGGVLGDQLLDEVHDQRLGERWIQKGGAGPRLPEAVAGYRVVGASPNGALGDFVACRIVVDDDEHVPHRLYILARSVPFVLPGTEAARVLGQTTAAAFDELEAARLDDRQCRKEHRLILQGAPA